MKKTSSSKGICVLSMNLLWRRLQPLKTTIFPLLPHTPNQVSRNSYITNKFCRISCAIVLQNFDVFTHRINHVFKWWTVETGWNYCIYGNAIEHDRLFHYLFCYGKSMYCLNAIKINLIVHTFQTAKYIYLSGNRGKKATQRMLLFRDRFSPTAADRR